MYRVVAQSNVADTLFPTKISFEQYRPSVGGIARTATITITTIHPQCHTNQFLPQLDSPADIMDYRLRFAKYPVPEFGYEAKKWLSVEDGLALSKPKQFEQPGR